MILNRIGTPANTASPFGRGIDGSLKLRDVAEMIDWDGAEQKPVDDSAKDSIPLFDNDDRSALFPEAIIPVAKSDVREQTLCVVDGCVMQILVRGRSRRGPILHGKTPRCSKKLHQTRFVYDFGRQDSLDAGASPQNIMRASRANGVSRIDGLEQIFRSL